MIKQATGRGAEGKGKEKEFNASRPLVIKPFCLDASQRTDKRYSDLCVFVPLRCI
jgi:hypothetical protein